MPRARDGVLALQPASLSPPATEAGERAASKYSYIPFTPYVPS